MYFNVELLSPTGAKEMHIAVIAESAAAAAAFSPIALTMNSNYQPSDFIVIAVYPTPEDQLPLESK